MFTHITSGERQPDITIVVPYFYIPTYSQQKIGTNESTALYTLVGAVAASFFGRLVSGVCAHYVGAIVAWMFCTVASGILSLAWISISTKGGFIAFSVLWGM